MALTSAHPAPPLLVCRLLALALTLALASARKIPASITPISRDLYHSSDSILGEIKALVARNSDSLTMDTVRASNKGYSAEMFVVTFNHAKETVEDGSKIKIMLSFGQHGRELITSEVALSLLYILTEKRRIAGVDLSSFEKILEHLVIKVVPMENFNGRKRVEAGELCDRRNGRGVDLNRNWSVDWGKKEKDYNPFEEDPGTAPFSEPEAQIMQELSKSFKPHIWVNVHSGMEALFMPYDHKNTTPDGAPSQLMRSLLENLNRRHFQDSCLVGSGGGAVGYLAHGTTTDYLYDIAKVPMPFTFEIYGDEKASTDDCFKMFNPVEKTTFDRVINKWCMAFLILFEEGLRILPGSQVASQGALDNWVPMGGEILERNADEKNGNENRQLEGLDLGMQELKTYFRLFIISTFLLMFMFCSRISKNRNRESDEQSIA
ncbi:metallocarboxypeptidase A-like protein ARB_03789 [Lolium rigidum]|uniref:metallocarboxypeptidase A-like protein ARB_03789 n=1 Tax=Lolium rigidum TaxID=89674 RepID=UPI001F5CDF8D|nr:metallocarboxypeptidase A-like protein ARB_03789 isoform X1 [Lolium rigidum]XP_047080867.1 metallocarboxypeptidase A-like protein ARB_03789 [Lolium rigidum]